MKTSEIDLGVRHVLIPIKSLKWRLDKMLQDCRLSRRFTFHGIEVSPFESDKIKMTIKAPYCKWPGCKRHTTHFLVNESTGGLTPLFISDSGFACEMNVDHKIARCLGGSDAQSNKWTMCLMHNKEKAKLEGSLNNLINGQKPGFLVRYKHEEKQC